LRNSTTEANKANTVVAGRQIGWNLLMHISVCTPQPPSGNVQLLLD